MSTSRFKPGQLTHAVREIVAIVAYMGLGHEAGMIRMTTLAYFLKMRKSFSKFEHQDFVDLFHEVDGRTYKHWKIRVHESWVIVE